MLWLQVLLLFLGIGMDSSVTPPRHGGLSLVQTTDFFYPLVDDPYMMGKTRNFDFSDYVERMNEWTNTSLWWFLTECWWMYWHHTKYIGEILFDFFVVVLFFQIIFESGNFVFVKLVTVMLHEDLIYISIFWFVFEIG